MAWRGIPCTCGEHVRKKLQVIVLAQPVRLRGQVAVEDIAFLVLEAPRDDDQDIALADPGAFLDLALDPAQPVDAVVAFHADMVCPQVCTGAGKLFVQFLFREPDADDRCAVRVEFGGTVCVLGFSSIMVNANISGEVNQWRAG